MVSKTAGQQPMFVSSGDPALLVSRPIAVGLMIPAVVSLVLSIRGHRKVEARMEEMEKVFQKIVEE